MITMAEIACLTDVSQPTVSRVLNGGLTIQAGEHKALENAIQLEA